MENPPAQFPAWPGGAEVAVALTFDVDGEAPWLSEGPEYARRLTMLSQGRFGPARGLGRILALLDELNVTATFYVPGHTADQHPGAVEAILAGGHEVGHHGYLHRGHQRPGRRGRGYLVRMLNSVITGMAERGRPWFATR